MLELATPTPLDKFQTVFKLTVNSLKTISNATIGTGFLPLAAVALMYELDDILASTASQKQKKESLDILYPGAASSIKKTLNDLQLNDSINNAMACEAKG